MHFHVPLYHGKEMQAQRITIVHPFCHTQEETSREIRTGRNVCRIHDHT